MDEVFVFDHQSANRERPNRGIVHEVHQPTALDPVVRVSGSMLLRHDEMVRANVCFKPFHKMPIVEAFTTSDPVVTRWPHDGKFAALSYTEGGVKA